METAFSGFELIGEMVEKGNPNSISDAGVGALALRSCVKGAFLNVKINASSLNDKDFISRIISQGNDLESKTERAEELILKKINSTLVNQ